MAEGFTYGAYMMPCKWDSATKWKREGSAGDKVLSPNDTRSGGLNDDVNNYVNYKNWGKSYH